MTTELRVHMRHVRAAKLCSRGTRAWFAKHGLSYDAFLSDGIPAETLRGLDDALANRCIAEAEKEAAGERR